MALEEIKYKLLKRLEPLIEKINQNGPACQYVTINSSCVDFETKDNYQLCVEVMVDIIIYELTNKIRISNARIQEIFLFKNDGEDVNNFNILKADIEKQILEK